MEKINKKSSVKSLYEFTNEMIKNTIKHIGKNEELEKIIYNPLYKTTDFYKDGILLYYCSENIRYFKNEKYNNTVYYIQPLHCVYIKGKEIRNIDFLDFPDDILNLRKSIEIKFKITISNSSKENKKFNDVIKNCFNNSKTFWIKVNLHRCEYNGHPFYNKSIIDIDDDKFKELSKRIIMEEYNDSVFPDCRWDFTLDEFDNDYNYIGSSESIMQNSDINNTDKIEV
jgi:hypothetical protein